MTTKKARMCVARKTRRTYKEGYPLKQSVAIAYSTCRKKGYRSLKKVS